MKSFLTLIFMTLLVVGCSFSKLSEEEATTIAIEFAKNNAVESNLSISTNELRAIQTERVHKMNKWVIYIDYPDARNREDIKISPSGWVAVSDNKKVLGYNFALWGGEHKQD